MAKLTMMDLVTIFSGPRDDHPGRKGGYCPRRGSGHFPRRRNQRPPRPPVGHVSNLPAQPQKAAA